MTTVPETPEQGAGVNLPKAYDPRETEPRWYRAWEESGFFTASSDPKDVRAPYTIAIPPPNVTGSLHMGHACRITFEDVLIRYERMRGRNALWVPGTDHAGIATQVVVERQLARKNQTRQQLGRPAFVERVWEWKRESGGRILQQLRVLGASCDWTRERFTMDEGLSRAVRHAFVSLYREGLIYRATRLVNWDVQSQTVLSDLEVENEENAQGELFDFAYPIEGGGEIVVSTTRPETMLGDTAIAVHPEDPRYRALHGRFALHPFVGRKVPIITDAVLVDPKFGTGAVKVTPAHDWNDFATGKRHQLEEINILNLNGTLNEQAGPFAGMDRFAARKAVKAALEERGLARGTRVHTLMLPRSQRSGTVVEPMISTQWYVKMKPLAEPAIAAVEQGKTKIIPEHWEKTYFHWMRDIQDWCISRQLWWGHTIPAWYCQSCNHTHVAMEAPSRCESCKGAELKQDEDVLDTWFSSGLWPFSTLGWPDETPDLARFYPTDDMETGYDILFFWVARMMMLGIHFMGEVPFKRVLLSGLVTDERGDKMSKVKGNVIDPLDVISGASLEHLLETAQKNGAKESGLEYLRSTYPKGFAAYGADSLRFTLLSYSPHTTKIALSIKRIEGYRNFGNKLWNAARYVLMNLHGTDARAEQQRPAAQLFANRWILSRLAQAIETTHRGIGEYRLDEASGALYHFVWHELCDWYVELVKPLLAARDAAAVAETRAVLVHVLETALRLLHPMMPFITEEIWQRVPKNVPSERTIMLAPYPELARDALRAPEVEREMTVLQAVIVAARAIRSERDIHPRNTLPLHLRSDDAAVRSVLERERGAIATLCNAEVHVAVLAGVESDNSSATAVAEGVTVVVPLSGLIDPAKERERLERQLQKLEKDRLAIEKKLGNPGFVERAPAEVVQKERERLAELAGAMQQLSAALAKLA